MWNQSSITSRRYHVPPTCQQSLAARVVNAPICAWCVRSSSQPPATCELTSRDMLYRNLLRNDTGREIGQLLYKFYSQCWFCLQCFDAVGWAAGRASGLWKTEWWDAGMVMGLGQGADLHMAQLMPLSLTVSCSSKSRLVLPFWCCLIRVVPDNIQAGRNNGCVCVCVGFGFVSVLFATQPFY